MSQGDHMYLTVQYSSSIKGYGFEMDGSQSGPIRVSWVSHGSPSDKAGLLKDDLLLQVNGHDVSTAMTTTVQAIISYTTGSPLTLMISRPINKVSTDIQSTSDVHSYQTAVGDAMRSAQDALTMLGLGPVATASNGREESEVLINLEEQQGGYCSDQSSPPSSTASEHSEDTTDPILDFTRGTDEYSHDTPAHVSAALVGGVIRTQQALQGIKNIMKPTSTSSSTVQASKVSTEASIVITPKKKSNKEDEVLEPVSSPVKWSTPSQPTQYSPSPSSTSSSSPSHSYTQLHPPSPSPAPPIPPYNPSIPDQFPLSNRPEYQLQRKRIQHSYEDVKFDEDNDPSDNVVVLRTKPSPTAAVAATVPKEGGPLVSEHYSHHPLSYSSVVLTGSLDPIQASSGLPSSVHTWKLVHVSSWLQQLNLQLYELYGECFTKHSVTGHTLLHFNQTKLQYIGITNKDHRMQLAMAIARLRLHHEQKELERLSGQVSWL